MQKQLKTRAIGKTQYNITLSVLMFLYCAALPFEEALASSLGSVLRLIGIAIIGYCILMYSRESIKPETFAFLMPFLIWLFWAGFSILWSDDFSWWAYFFGIYFVQVVFLAVVLFYSEHIDIKYIKNGLIVGAFIAATLLIFMQSDAVLTEEGRRTLIILGKEFDPNIVASIIILGLFANIDKIFCKVRNRKIYVLLTVYLAIGMLYTGSRGALISFVAGFAIQILLELKKQKTRSIAILMLGVCFIGVIVALAVLPEELVLSRFSKETIFGINELKNGEHNRYTIWGYAIELIKKSPVIGYGCGNFFSAIAKVYKQTASHNMYILVMLEEGIIGFSVLLFGIGKLLINTYKRQLYSIFAMLFSICVMALTLDSITYKYFWVAIILSAISIKESNGREITENE